MASETKGETLGGSGPSAPSRSSREVLVGRVLLRALRNTDISVLYQDDKLNIVWAENAPGGWTSRSLAGTGADGLLSEADARRLADARQSVLDGGPQQRFEICVPDPKAMRWFDVWIDADQSESGKPAGVITTTVDITDQKRREQTLRALLREVSHRSKNLLAIIQSIASQTGRYAESIGEFLTLFRGRIQSLAASQDLVTSSDWRGADLHQLIAGQVVRYCEDPVKNVRMDGRNPYLNPNAALHIGLALHELAVGSVTNGAFSRPGGVVRVSALPVDENPGSALELVWREESRSSSGNRHFGSVTLERVVPAALNGTSTLTVDEGGLVYRLVIPASNFEVE